MSPSIGVALPHLTTVVENLVPSVLALSINIGLVNTTKSSWVTTAGSTLNSLSIRGMQFFFSMQSWSYFAS